MAIQLTATQARAQFFALLRQVEAGEEIEITIRGRVVARLTPVRGPLALKNRFAGIVTSNASDDELFTTGVRWNAQ